MSLASASLFPGFQEQLDAQDQGTLPINPR